jgi:hypothetical protein
VPSGGKKSYASDRVIVQVRGRPRGKVDAKRCATDRSDGKEERPVSVDDQPLPARRGNYLKQDNSDDYGNDESHGTNPLTFSKQSALMFSRGHAAECCSIMFCALI